MMIKKVAPFLTAVLAFLLGALWYSQYLFGSLWKKYLGEEMNNDNMMMPMIVSFIIMNVMAFSMRWLMQKAKVPATYKAGFTFSLMIALMFVSTSLGIVYVYSGKPYAMMMWAIDAGYQVVFLTIMGTILAMC